MTGPLQGLRVIDAASLFAGPVIASLMGDFGADVIKIEHPTGDALRKMVGDAGASVKNHTVRGVGYLMAEEKAG